ncbi:hypothetical protein GYMLUDRAFT_247988 [Collybiopsis luxurians FD-317 M1]|uniref:Unplaced genomic scaffold GYMLUscaffold_51, whole genome shotgun sequence n=1 Tax=Collybiopsis luxurians FD-317 M1 TaxID=944289 RepID=A0A0D0BMS2_9AGAR|nr:hypothetical protein GYMLUDRAFT_247988 [Collybiopsis luxurians FD-317 M1]
MNIFLLDPSARLLSAFNDYVFIDTGIECVMSSNWSCILFESNVVIHCEDSDAAFQHFYPLQMLYRYARTLRSRQATPVLCGRVVPFESIVKRFVFPVRGRGQGLESQSQGRGQAQSQGRAEDQAREGERDDEGEGDVEEGGNGNFYSEGDFARADSSYVGT